MKTLLTGFVLLLSLQAGATEVPLKMDCKGTTKGGEAVTLKSGAEYKWTQSPYYWSRNELLTLTIDGKETLLLSQNPELSKAAGVLRVGGAIAPGASSGFLLLANIQSKDADLQIDGVRGHITLECRYSGL